jgi:DHA1 family inner membrane transport protein
MTLTTARMNRRTLLIGLMAIFTLGNFLSAVAGDYTTLMVARVITSLNHGAFFGVGSVVAASLVAPEKRASAVAAMFMGLTLANVIGVPLAPWVGETFGWRTAFGAIAVWGLITMAALRFALPDIGRDTGGNMLAELGVLKRREVLIALALTAIGSSAMFTVFTYIAPILTEATHAGTLFVTAMLVIYGLGLTAGNWLGGVFADKSIDRTLIVSLAGLAATLVIFAGAMFQPLAGAVTIFVWGVATFAIVPPLQMRVMEAASDAPNLASAVNIGAFNLGNAVGAAVGGGVIGLGLGYPAVSFAGAAMALGGLAIVFATRARPAASLAQA